MIYLYVIWQEIHYKVTIFQHKKEPFIINETIYNFVPCSMGGLMEVPCFNMVHPKNQKKHLITPFSSIHTLNNFYHYFFSNIHWNSNIRRQSFITQVARVWDAQVRLRSLKTLTRKHIRLRATSHLTLESTANLHTLFISRIHITTR